MNRGTKRVLSVICAISMVVTSMAGLKLTNVVADTTTTVITTSSADSETRTALLSEIASEDYNFALGKNASVSQLTTTDGGTDLSIITNGKFTKGSNSKTTIIEIGRGNKTDDPWVQVDLGNAYDTSKIDRIAVQYKTNNSGPKSGYYISYSLNGVDFVTVAEVGAIAGSADQIYLDKIALTSEQAKAIPYVKFIRVTSTTDNSAWGLQVKGMAVLTDGITKVSEVAYEEVASLDNPASLTVTSSDFNQLEFSFEGAEGHDDYTYYAYVDNQLKNENATPGTTYTVTGLTAGDHVVKVCSYKDGSLSDGISQTVTVTDTKSLLTDVRNLATGKTAKASSIRDGYVEENITDGSLTTQFRTVTSDTSSTIVIDLEQNYRLDAIERTVGFYLDNRYPTAYTIEYSLNGTDYETVATAVGESTVQTVEIDPSDCTLPAVRYVRFSLSSPVAAGYGFQMYELGVIAKEGADLTPVEVATVEDPANVEVDVTGYNKADVTITAGEGQEDYKYNIYVDGDVVMTGVDAGTYTITDIEAGEKVFIVKSAYDGVTSEGISVTKTIQSAITYNYETLAASVVEAGKAVEASKTVGDVTYNNYSLFMKASATVSTEENATLTADKVLDGDTTTRWSSIAGEDPQWIIVDLGGTYDIHELDIVWQTASAKDYDIEYSVDGVEYTKIGSVKNAVTGSRYDNIVLTDVATARYVKINGTARTGVYGYSIWDMGIYGPDEEDTTPADVKGLVVTAGVATWQSAAYATSYNVYVNNDLVATSIDATYDLSEHFDGNGTYTVGVQAVGNDGATSNITSVQVEYNEDETTTEAPEPVFGWEIQYADGNGFVATEFGMEGFVIENIPAGTDKWSCGARLQNIPVEAGKTYTVSFSVTSTVNKVVPVEFTNGTAEYINVNATPEGAVYSQEFTAVGNTVKLYMPLGVDATVDGTIEEAYSITVSNVTLVESTEEESTTPEPVVETYEVSVDGDVVATADEGDTYTLPTDSELGYLYNDTAYKAGATVTVNSDMAFTSIGEVSVAVATGAGIRYTDATNGGIRFQATVTASADVKASAAVTTGMLITANDLYTQLGNSTLSLDSEYTFINVVNNGWLKETETTATYCGSIVNIDESNWIREFIAKAYVTITYADGTTETVYSGMTGARSIAGVAKKIQNAGYPDLDDAAKAVIDTFAAAK